MLRGHVVMEGPPEKFDRAFPKYFFGADFGSRFGRVVLCVCVCVFYSKYLVPKVQSQIARQECVIVIIWVFPKIGVGPPNHQF